MEFDNITVGMSASYSQTITDSDVKSFSGLSGDKNPIHMDENYASVSRYKKRIVHGLLPCSFFSALFGTKLPGEGSVYASQSIKFLRPIYLGDTVTAIIIVKSLDHERHNIDFETICKVNNKVVINGEARIFVPQTKNKFN